LIPFSLNPQFYLPRMHYALNSLSNAHGTQPSEQIRRAFAIPGAMGTLELKAKSSRDTRHNLEIIPDRLDWDLTEFRGYGACPPIWLIASARE